MFGAFDLSDNYYDRICYLKKEQVPTQTVMKQRMSPALANVYFKSMRPQLKVLAGLEPPMKGGGSDWFIPPEELLRGRVVMKPIKKEFLSKLSFNGIAFLGEQIVAEHKKNMEKERVQVLLENDINWNKSIEANCRQLWEDRSKEAAKENTLKIQRAFHEFTSVYTTSITKIETILFEATVNEIKKARQDTFDKMQKHFETLLKQQATMLYDRYTELLLKEKARIKSEFIEKLENARTELGHRIHDINAEKHSAIEKLRNLVECQNLACQIYVALKEREECKKEMDLSKYEHKKQVKVLTQQIAMQDFEIKLAKEKERKRLEFIDIWKKKVCEVVKKFQLFVAYSLNTLPEHAEFFLNMEKLMLLHLNEAQENPNADSIFEPEPEQFRTPIPRPHPFFLFCDKGYIPIIDQNLCPEHCTSSATQLPVIVVNKRCIYAACDNFEKFTDKVTQFVHGRRGNEKDFLDDHDYTYNVPIKYTSAHQLLELKLESSLLQILQKELPNVKGVSTECCICKVPYCYCNPLQASIISTPRYEETKKSSSIVSLFSGNKIEKRSVELMHEREPKWDSYMEYVKSKKCMCPKMCKKHLKEHLPPYMRQMSKFVEPDLPHYEKCSVYTLKKLVRQAQGKQTPPPESEKTSPRAKHVGTQYSEPEFDFLCTCFSDDEVEKLFQVLIKDSKMFDKTDTKTQCRTVTGSLSPSYLTQKTSSFVTQRAFSLRNLLDNAPELKEIFRKNTCDFNN